MSLADCKFSRLKHLYEWRQQAAVCASARLPAHLPACNRPPTAAATACAHRLHW
jgi:hypothetical protein